MSGSPKCTLEKMYRYASPSAFDEVNKWSVGFLIEILTVIPCSFFRCPKCSLGSYNKIIPWCFHIQWFACSFEYNKGCQQREHCPRQKHSPESQLDIEIQGNQPHPSESDSLKNRKNINPFTPKSDQCQISPPAPPEILHHTVSSTYLFIA